MSRAGNSNSTSQLTSISERRRRLAETCKIQGKLVGILASYRITITSCTRNLSSVGVSFCAIIALLTDRQKHTPPLNMIQGLYLVNPRLFQ